MSEFRNLPQSFVAEKNDELLLATPTEATRISVKSFKYDSLATLKFKHPADQSYGVGQANNWATLPFNNLAVSGENWITLNPDGSFLLEPGLFYLEAELSILASEYQRLGLFRETTINEVVGQYAPALDNTSVNLRLSKKLSLTGQETYSLRVAVSNPKVNTFNVIDSFLAGYQVTLATCEIHKLG